MINAGGLADWLATLGPHLYCCGHVHTAWAISPRAFPDQLCLNSGAPLLRDHTGDRPPGFLEVVLTGPEVVVNHHFWSEGRWEDSGSTSLCRFFLPRQAAWAEGESTRPRERAGNNIPDLE